MEMNRWQLHIFFLSTCQTETVEEPIEEDAETAEEPEKETSEDEAEVEEEEEDKDKPKTKKVGSSFMSLDVWTWTINHDISWELLCLGLKLLLFHLKLCK